MNKRLKPLQPQKLKFLGRSFNFKVQIQTLLIFFHNQLKQFARVHKPATNQEAFEFEK